MQIIFKQQGCKNKADNSSLYIGYDYNACQNPKGYTGYRKICEIVQINKRWDIYIFVAGEEKGNKWLPSKPTKGWSSQTNSFHSLADAKAAICEQLTEEEISPNMETINFIKKMNEVGEKEGFPKLETMPFPITVNGIQDNTSDFHSLYKRGGYVKIRPCDKEYGNTKTYLGLLLGELPQNTSIEYDKTTDVLTTTPYCNPAIYVFELNKIIFGSESWWSKIKSSDDLTEISDADINSVWYVQMLKQLQESKKEE